MTRVTRILCLLPLVLSGCDSLVDKAANQMPVIGERCQSGICLTDDDARQSQAYDAYRAREQQFQQQQYNSGYYATMQPAPEDAAR